MSLAYYKAVRKRLALRRLVVRKAALAAEKVLRTQDPPDLYGPYALRCERPGCGHEKVDHALRDSSSRGGCCVAFCRCRGYYLGPVT